MIRLVASTLAVCLLATNVGGSLVPAAFSPSPTLPLSNAFSLASKARCAEKPVLGLRMQERTVKSTASEIDWKGLPQMGDDWLRSGPQEEGQVNASHPCAKWRRTVATLQAKTLPCFEIAATPLLTCGAHRKREWRTCPPPDGT
jgi:hypothetical protein